MVKRIIFLLMFAPLFAFGQLGMLSHRRAAFREYDEDTVLLCHFDGTDGATTSTDSALGGNAPHALTFEGDPELDTAQKKFGTASVLLDGTGDGVSCVNNSDWHFGSGDFTAECWVRWSAVNFNTSEPILSLWDSGASQRSWEIYRYADGSTSRIYFFISSDGTTNANDSIFWTPTVDTWYHFALVRYGNEFDLYRDGTSILNLNNSMTLQAGTGKLGIGCDFNNGTLSAEFPGNIDEVRISKGIARYTNNFTPSGPFTP